MTTQTKVHVRDSELAATIAVAAHNLAEAGGIDVFTYWSHDADGFAHHVKVTDVMWSAGTVPAIIFVLENGQEFEAEVRPSSKKLREARTALDAATQAAERKQGK